MLSPCGSLSHCSPPVLVYPLADCGQPTDNTRSWRAASFVQGFIDLLRDDYHRRGGVPRLPCGSCEPAGSVCGDPPLRPKSLCSHVESLSANEQVEMCPCSAILSLSDRVGGWKLSISKLRSCTQIAIWLRLIRVVAFLRQRAVPEAAAAARARTSFRRSSVDGGGTGREKAPKIEEGTEQAAPVPKRSSRHPHDPPGPAGHSISCPCHQLCWVQIGGARPPAEEGQRKVVGDHHKVRLAAHGEEPLSAQALIARREGAGRQVQAACARGRNLCVEMHTTVCDPKDQCAGCPQGCAAERTERE
jgi:hypothetical protein